MLIPITYKKYLLYYATCYYATATIKVGMQGSSIVGKDENKCLSSDLWTINELRVDSGVDQMTKDYQM